MHEVPERDLRWIAQLAQRLGLYVWEQLKRQEGSWVGAVHGAVVFVGGATFLVRWDRGDVKIEPMAAVKRPSFPNFAMLNQAHPPMLELSQAISGYPFRVPYSCSAGMLAGRTGELLVHAEDQFEDIVIAMS